MGRRGSIVSMSGGRIIAALAVAAALSVAPQAARAGSAAPSQVREFEHLASPALGRDLAYALYLPPGYDAGDRRYPTLYLLHGVDGNHQDWLHTGYLRETLDALIADGRVAPMVVVMPDGDNSWYVDSKAVGGPGDYETAIAGDLVTHIDATLRTRADRLSRGIGGLSMGGFGALRLAFRKPFRYGAAAAFSGALWARVHPDTVLGPRTATIFAGAFGTPFDTARFVAESPFAMVDGLAAARDPPAIFLTVGDHDRFKLYLDSFQLFERLRELSLPVEMRMTAGDHDWETWAAELGDALVFFDRHFRRQS
jgi:S-formylglutathione hydrolase FrmB